MGYVPAVQIKGIGLAAVILLVVGLSGCVSDAQGETPEASTMPLTENEPPTMPSSEVNTTAGTLHNITVNVAFTSPGVNGPGGGIDAPTCAPAPTDCRTGVHIRIDYADANVFNGTTIDTAWVYPDSVEHRTMAGIWVFTGTIVGCTGSGTAIMPWTSGIDESPIAVDPNGDVFNEHDYITTPTNTTGFARIAEVYLDADYYLNPADGASGHGTMTGYILCE